MKCYWVNVYSKNGKITYGGLWLSEDEARNAPRSIKPVYRIRVRFKRKIKENASPYSYCSSYCIIEDNIFCKNG